MAGPCKTFTFVLLALLSISSPAAFAQTITLKEQAAQMGNALVRRDYKTFVSFSYPAVVKQMGGADKMASTIAAQMKGMEAGGQQIVSLTYGAPSSPIKAGKELQATIPQQMIVKIKEGRIAAESILIAISQDKGQHWYFVDAGERDLATIRRSLPNISKSLVIPKAKAPQMVK
jgi:hypothetical protein